MIKNRRISGFFDGIHRIPKYIKNNKKSVLMVLGCYIAAVIIAFVAFLTVYRHNRYYLFCYELIALLITSAILFRKSAAIHPERFFVVTALLMGSFLIYMSPPTVGTMWDDEVHYENTLKVANGLDGIMYEADEIMLEEYLENKENHYGYDHVSRAELSERLNESFEMGEASEAQFTGYSLSYIAYIPAALGIMIGRGLSLPFTWIFMIGKFCNLLMYVIVFYYAIKRIPHGKVFLACIGLIPTTVFMACSYSYDPWLISFTALGYSYLFACLQEDSKIKARDYNIMIISVGIGCLVKAVYFPMLFPFLFLPTEKFEDKKQKQRSVGLVILVGLLLVASFLLPLVSTPDSYSDSRGGEGIDAMGQLMFILGAPMSFASILFEFLKDTLRFENWAIALTSFAYMGNGVYYVLITSVLLATAFMYKAGKRTCTTAVRITGMIGLLGALILSTTAMYISFTPVGEETVNGYQLRYLLPFFYPFFYLIGGDGDQTDRNEWYAVLPMLIIGICFAWNMELLLARYY